MLQINRLRLGRCVPTPLAIELCKETNRWVEPCPPPLSKTQLAYVRLARSPFSARKDVRIRIAENRPARTNCTYSDDDGRYLTTPGVTRRHGRLSRWTFGLVTGPPNDLAGTSPYRPQIAEIPRLASRQGSRQLAGTLAGRSADSSQTRRDSRPATESRRQGWNFISCPVPESLHSRARNPAR
jgi:hypothetical protein